MQWLWLTQLFRARDDHLYIMSLIEQYVCSYVCSWERVADLVLCVGAYMVVRWVYLGMRW